MHKIQHEKLNHINGYYIRQKSIEELTKLCFPYLKTLTLPSPKGRGEDGREGRGDFDLNFLQGVVASVRERLEKLSDVAPMAEFFFQEELEYDPKILVWKKSTLEDAEVKLQMAYDYFKLLPEDSFKKDFLERVFKELISEKGIGVGDLLWPLRVALTGREASPSPFEVAEVLGKDKALKRIQRALVLLNRE